MVLDLNTTIGFSILLPFTLGKLDPRRTIQLVHLLIRGIQFITDPVVNTVGLVPQKLLFGPLLRTCQKLVGAGFFHSVPGEYRARDVTQALASTVSLFSMHRQGRVLTPVISVSTWLGFGFIHSG